LREELKEFRVEELGPKFNFLLAGKEQTICLFKALCGPVLEYISSTIGAEKANGIARGTLLEGRSGVDFTAKISPEEEFRDLLSQLFDLICKSFGELRARKVLGDAYESVRKEYSPLLISPDSLAEIFRIMPEGVAPPGIHSLKFGRGYLAKDLHRGFELFKDATNHGFSTLCISRTHPDVLRKEYGLESEVIWLSETPCNYNTLSPTNRAQLIGAIDDFTSRYGHSIILLDGLEYLITKNGYERVLSLLQQINELIAVKKSCLIVPVNASALKERELALLEREFGELP
jgi:hypothetical protein